MTSETTPGDKLQVVFLIDENLSRPFVEDSYEETSKSVPLCVLRILSYLNDRFESRFHWGYKFYSSSSLTHRYERHNFQEFSIKEFENFEKCLGLRFKESRKNTQQQQTSNSSSCLSCALTEVIHDFQWETNDINSPLRATRSTSSHKRRNIVFLLTSCPKSLQSLEVFTGRNVEQLESFQNSMMSSALVREFVDIYGIDLYWIDTAYNDKFVDSKVVDVINNFLQTLNGKVIPLQALVATDGLQITQDEGPLISLSSVLNHYIRIPSKISEKPSMTVFSMGEGFDFSNWTGLLCSSGSPPIAHCAIQLNPMLSTMTTTTSTTTTNTNQRVSLSISNNDKSVTRHTIQLSHNTSGNHNQCSGSPNQNVFWIKGAIKREKICPTWFQLTKVYSCIAMAGKQDPKQEGEPIDSWSSLSGWFQRLLVLLSRQNLLLVIEMKDPVSSMPVTSVLQPLTSLCGTINVINTDRLLVMEKLLAWRQPQEEWSNQNKVLYNNIHLAEMYSNDTRVPSQSEIHSSILDGNIDDESAQSKVFSLQDVDSWSLGLACLQPGPDIVRQKQEESNKKEAINSESCLIKKLKELYSQKKANLKKKTPKKLKKHLSRDNNGKKLTKSAIKKEKEHTKSQNMDDNKKVHMPLTSSTSTASTTDKPEQDKIQELLSTLDLNDEIELKTFLKDLYNQAVSEIGIPSKLIDKTMAVINWYNSKQTNTYPEISIKTMIRDVLLMDNLTIRDKYDGQTDRKESKLIEYQLQVLLRLELVSSSDADSDSNSSLIEEVVVMLRSISFIKDPAYLRDFLREVIIIRYVEKIPKFLCEIYEGLMLNLPPELLSPSKQEEEESPLKRCLVSVIRPESDQPRSEGARPLTRHRSIADIGGRRREIVIPGKAKTKKTHKKGPSSTQKKRNVPPKPKVQKTPVKKVRRNLFTEDGTEEAQSDLTKKVKLKVPSIFGKDERKQKPIKRRHSVAAHAPKVVQETPCRKQLSNALWQKQHRARKRTSTVTEELNVVQESPLKEIIEGENLPRRSPRRHPGSVFQRSRSFYGGKSCPLVRTKSCSSAIQSHSPIKKLDLDEQESFIEDHSTQDDIPPSSTSVKESPVRVSPRRRSRFSLHTLLTSTETPNSKKSKVLTPKKDEPVRSSPRLLKKRSFSCIGFSNSVRLERSASSESVPESRCRVVTPSKKVLQSPTRSSPRLKKMEDARVECLTSSENVSGDSCRAVTPKKKILHTPTRSSPRLKKIEDARTECLPPREKVADDHSKSFTPKKILPSPVRSSPRLRKMEDGHLECAPYSKNVPDNQSKTTTPKKEASRTPTRSSPRIRKTGFTRLAIPKPNKNVSDGKREKVTPRKRLGRTDESYSNENAFCDITEVITPEKKVQLSPTRSSPSLRKAREDPSTKSFSQGRLVISLPKGNIGELSSPPIPATRTASPRAASSTQARSSPTFKKHIMKPLLLSDVSNTEGVSSEGGSQFVDDFDAIDGTHSLSERRHENTEDNEEEGPNIVKNGSKDLSINAESSQLSRSKSKEKLRNRLRKRNSTDDPSTSRLLRSRSNQKKRRATRSLDTIKDLPTTTATNSGHEMLRSNSEGCDTSQPIVTRKRLSFSPTRKSKRQNTKLTEENREIQTKNDTSPHSKNSKDKSIEPSASNEQSAKKTTTKQCSYVVDGQRLLSSKPIVATPPRKKRKPRAQSHNENKRSSPLNQILKQRKRTRPGSFKSPPSKRKNIEKSSVRHEVQTEHNHQRFVSSNIIDVDECSQSSEDMVMSWFSNITESDNSVKEESTSKETVDDNVFQDSSSFRRSKLRIFKPITPISKKSLQILQESPILSPINQSPPSSSSGFTRNFSDSSPNDICAHLSERLKRRKRSEVLAKKSSPSEDTAEVEPSTFRCSKRLKLASS